MKQRCALRRVAVICPGAVSVRTNAPVEAATREAMEECGLEVRIGTYVGTADELVYAPKEDIHVHKRCAFFLAQVTGYGVAREPDHLLKWLPVERALGELVHGSHRWAVAEAMRIRKD